MKLRSFPLWVKEPDHFRKRFQPNVATSIVATSRLPFGHAAATGVFPSLLPPPQYLSPFSWRRGFVQHCHGAYRCLSCYFVTSRVLSPFPGLRHSCLSPILRRVWTHRQSMTVALTTGRPLSLQTTAHCSATETVPAKWYHLYRRGE